MTVATNWNEVSLMKYEKLIELLKEESIQDDLDRSIEIYSILSDDPDNASETLYDMSISDLSVELNKIQFVTTPYKAKAPETEYIIDGKKYRVQLNLNEMTAAQYIDFQNFYKNYEANLKYIFLCFLIPNGCKYNEGYDVMQLADELYDKIPITVIMDIMIFFCRLSNALTQATLISSIREAKKMLRKEKDQKKRYQMKRAIVKARQALNLLRSETGFAGLTE